MKQLLAFLETDTVSFRPPEEDTAEVYAATCGAWDPVCDWFDEVRIQPFFAFAFNCRLFALSDLSSPSSSTPPSASQRFQTSILRTRTLFAEQHPETMEQVATELREMPHAVLAGACRGLQHDASDTLGMQHSRNSSYHCPPFQQSSTPLRPASHWSSPLPCVTGSFTRRKQRLRYAWDRLGRGLENKNSRSKVILTLIGHTPTSLSLTRRGLRLRFKSAALVS